MICTQGAITLFDKHVDNNLTFLKINDGTSDKIISREDWYRQELNAKKVLQKNIWLYLT